MKIRELQKQIADALNGVEELVQGGCTALAEDALAIQHELDKVLSAGGVSLVVVTPEAARSGSGVDGGVPVEMRLEIRCVERPSLNREVAGHLTALDAAEIVMHSLDGDMLEFERIAQTSDERTQTVTATASFGLNATLS